LILIELRLTGIGITAGIQHSVAEVLIKIAVESIAAGLGDHIYDGAGVAAVLGVKGVGDYAKLFGRGLNRGRIYELIVGVAAVYAEIVGAGAASVYGDRTGIVGAGEQAATRSQLRLYAGLKLQELVGVAGVQRKFVHRAVVDDRAELRARGIDLRSFGGYIDDFLRASDLQRGV